MEEVPVLSKEQLTQANDWAIKMGYNRALEPTPLKQFLEEFDYDVKFPITFHMMHEHAAGKKVEEHVRCVISLGPEGKTTTLDFDLDLFLNLEKVQVD